MQMSVGMQEPMRAVVRQPSPEDLDFAEISALDC